VQQTTAPTAPPVQQTTAPTAPPVQTTTPTSIGIVTIPPTVFIVPLPTTTVPPPNPPQIRSFNVSPGTVSSCGDLSPDALASVYDRDGDITAASVTWSGRNGSGSNALSGGGTQYTGSVGPFPPDSGATYTVTLTVVDSTGLKASSSTTVGVAPC
jgi:hypothetical protein